MNQGERQATTHLGSTKELGENKEAIISDIPKYMQSAYSKVIDRLSMEAAIKTDSTPIEMLEDMLFHLTVVTSHAGNLMGNMLIDRGAMPQPKTQEEMKQNMDRLLNQLMIKSQAIGSKNSEEFKISSPEEALVLYTMVAKSILEMTFSDLGKAAEIEEKNKSAQEETDAAVNNM